MQEQSLLLPIQAIDFVTDASVMAADHGVSVPAIAAGCFAVRDGFNTYFLAVAVRSLETHSCFILDRSCFAFSGLFSCRISFGLDRIGRVSRETKQAKAKH